MPRDPREGLPVDAQCLQCAYALRSLPGPRCPECGRAYDPSDPNTFRSDRRRRELWRIWAAPPSLWHVIPAILYTMVALHASSHPMGSANAWSTIILFFGGVLLGIALPLDYLSRVCAVWVCRIRGENPGPQRGGRWRWWVAPICLTIIVVTFSSNWLLKARFSLSQPAFERTAAACLAGTCPSGRQWIGLYYVREIEMPEPNTVWFMTGETIADPVGLEYRAGENGSTFGFSGWYEIEW